MPEGADRRAIEEVIRRQFLALAWREGEEADWDGFAADFLDGAFVVPAARPAAPRPIPDFVARMRELSRGPLRSFHERYLGAEIWVFGNVAVALAAVELTENGSEVVRNVEGLLLVRSDGRWRIAAQAWDPATAERPVPPDLGG